MNIFDTHCHYNLEPFAETWQKHWQEAQDHGVQKSVIVGTDWLTSNTALIISQQDPNLFSAIGSHPGNYQEMIFEISERLHQTFSDSAIIEKELREELLTNIQTECKELKSILTKKVVAIGETGLDYFRLPENVSQPLIKEIQQLAFAKHLQLAQESQLPLIIHVRDTTDEAYWDVLKILQKNAWQQPFILHCVSGPNAYVQKAIELGGYVGIAGNITYKNSDHLRELIEFAPADRRLLETDAPFLPPIPYRGKPCEPWMISETAKYVQNELELDLEQIYENSCRVFQLN